MRFPHRSRMRPGGRPAALAIVLTMLASAVTAVVYVAAPAQAAGCAAVIDQVKVGDVVIYAGSASRAVTTVTAHDPCTDSPYSTAGLFDVSGAVYLTNGDSVALYYNQSTTPTWTGASELGAFDKYSAIGRGTQSVEVLDTDLNSTYRDGLSFYVRRNVVANWFNASPEPVRKGAVMGVAGSFSRLSVSATGVARYVPYAAHQVDIYFKPSTSATYTKVSSALTTSTGYFARTMTATVDGCWKAYSVQTSYNAGRWTVEDCVDVQ
jgi:hypothetical protein